MVVRLPSIREQGFPQPNRIPKMTVSAFFFKEDILDKAWQHNSAHSRTPNLDHPFDLG